MARVEKRWKRNWRGVDSLTSGLQLASSLKASEGVVSFSGRLSQSLGWQHLGVGRCHEGVPGGGVSVLGRTEIRRQNCVEGGEEAVKRTWRKGVDCWTSGLRLTNWLELSGVISGLLVRLGRIFM